MAIKKSELYSSLWQSCDELRGGMDASQYKDYILTLLFVKYVSDKYQDKDDIVEIPEGGGFKDMVALKNKPNIGEGIDVIISKLAEANGLKGVIDQVSFNDDEKLGKGKEMVNKLTKLIGIFQNPALNFSQNRADGDDILGDAYEYLMRHFATQSGKSKGQFYTPAEVSRILAKVIGVEQAKSQSQTVYDPTCGSGSLLLKVADEAPNGLTIYGQEMDNATKALAVMNMWLHNNPTAEIWNGNTIAAPHWTEAHGKLKQFDFVVANPPFSTKSWSSGLIDEDSKTIKDPFERFEGFGVPPNKNGDYAFLLHILKSLKSKGKGAVILPHGVLFRGGAEAEIRTNLIKRGLIKGIIGLPANLFYGTQIPASIIILDKEGAEARENIFIIDASKGFIKDGNKNRLREQDLHRIVDVFNKQLEEPRYSRLVPVTEIEDNEYNLNIPRYIDNQEVEDIQDLSAHLQGGIPERDINSLENYWEVYPSLKVDLVKPQRKGYFDLTIAKANIKETIFKHPEFIKYTNELDKTFKLWKKANMLKMKGINTETKPKIFIHELSENLLSNYSKKALIDKYDIYQELMDYWEETMKDDVYMVSEDGWVAQYETTQDQNGEMVWGEINTDLIPKRLVINRYFSKEKKAIEGLEQTLEASKQALEEYKEEHSGEEGLLNEVTNDKGNISKSVVGTRIRKIKANPEFEEEKKVLNEYLLKLNEEAKAKKALKSAISDLDRQVVLKYSDLTVDEIQVLVIEDKWLKTIEENIIAEIDSISQRLTKRLKELAERYEYTMNKLDEKVNNLTKKVNAHLEKMGLVWS